MRAALPQKLTDDNEHDDGSEADEKAKQQVGEAGSDEAEHKPRCCFVKDS